MSNRFDDRRERAADGGMDRSPVAGNSSPGERDRSRPGKQDRADLSPPQEGYRDAPVRHSTSGRESRGIRPFANRAAGSPMRRGIVRSVSGPGAESKPSAPRPTTA